MADINMTPLGGVGQIEDRYLVCEGMPGIKKCVILETYAQGTRVFVIEFPEIGHSLPAILDNSSLMYRGHSTAIYVGGTIPDDIAEIKKVIVGVIEYGGQPDPDYFSINGIDENGKPTYDLADE